jgi:hypothetical protein
MISIVPSINDPSWKCMESVVISWIFGTINGELQDIAKECCIVVHQILLMIQHQLIGNSETCMIHLNATFCKFIQGDLSMSDYFCKMKSMADSFSHLDCMVFDRNLVLNILQGLNERYDNL